MTYATWGIGLALMLLALGALVSIAAHNADGEHWDNAHADATMIGLMIVGGALLMAAATVAHALWH
ncbi:MAG TPA: hypothetical protein VL614_15070 [Acetobacteraceae bacterium]|jgi:hypothetical protein|nr:hypothetical protein [Acetobacteraceae bacterium]